MNIQSKPRMDKAAFIAWNAGAEVRCELVGGHVIMMANVSRAHGLIALNLASVLRAGLDRQQWSVLVEFGVDAGPQTLRYPDVMVDRAGGGAKDYTATAPVLLAEVLSPSTAAIDLGDKAAEYLRLPSLLAYLVVSQDEPKVWTWIRGSSAFSAGPEVFSGAEAVIRISALSFELPLADIYAGVPMD